MTTISAKVIADSFYPGCPRITTLELRYPRFIHSEFMTHREFSRNASSSRAIPVKKLIQDVEQDPVVPLHWGKNQPGMQARDVLSQSDQNDATAEWLTACAHAINQAKRMADLGVHKQIVNRILEPFSHISVVVTSTNWSNFFGLRRHEDAEPHIRMLADAMWEAMKASHPEPKTPGDWHLPYIKEEDYELTWKADPVVIELMNRSREQTIMPALLKMSVARCARVSYLNHDGTRNIHKDIELYEKLVGSTPLHASPAEHQASPDPSGRYAHKYGNLKGWIQYRKTLPNEYITGVEP